MLPDFLTNTYLVGEPGGDGVLRRRRRPGRAADRGRRARGHDAHARPADPPPLRPRARARELLERWPDLEVLIHPAERDLVDAATGDLVPGETLQIGDEDDRAAAHARPHRGHGRAARRRPGLHRRHALQGLGRRRARARQHELRGPQGVDHGHADEAAAGDDRSSPGHTDPTTIGDELEDNAFIRVWRGLDPEGDEPCTALGEPATLSSSATTTTAATRPGSAGPTGATTSSPARRSSARLTGGLVHRARGGPARRDDAGDGESSAAAAADGRARPARRDRGGEVRGDVGREPRPHADEAAEALGRRQVDAARRSCACSGR